MKHWYKNLAKGIALASYMAVRWEALTQIRVFGKVTDEAANN